MNPLGVSGSKDLPLNVTHKDYKAVTSALKPIYRAPSE